LESETSRQQAKWFFFDAPKAEHYWQEADIVHCTAESYIPARKARLAVTLHDAAYLERDAHRRDGSFHKQRLKWRFLYRKLLRRADLFHTVSHFSAERLIHFFPEIQSRLKVVHNAVTSHFFEPVTEKGEMYLERVGLSSELFILVPGGLHFRKNAELILQAWPWLRRLHPQLRLAVVNHSDSRYANRATAVDASVKMLGFVPDDGLRSLYAAARVVWFPSRYEGFGLPVLEAMACGAAVVASQAASLPEIAGKAAVLASANKPSEHVDALDSLLSNDSLRRDFQKRGIERAAGFRWEQSASQLKGYFDELL
jgi:glycosyltransferase involved in cell wall biosynthesis